MKSLTEIKNQVNIEYLTLCIGMIVGTLIIMLIVRYILRKYSNDSDFFD